MAVPRMWGEDNRKRGRDLIVSAPELNGHPIEWSRLLEEALSLPGGLGNTYSRFYEYSFANQLLLYMQGVKEPVATYKRWQDMGRQVLKGSKAKAILRPIIAKGQNDAGEDESRVRGFKMVRCLFGVSETDGEPLPEVPPREWSRQQALRTLDIHEVPFQLLNGNVQGYASGRELAINPVAAYPLKTTFHEVGHIVLGHTAPDSAAEYQQHRGVREFQAEATAYLCANELEVTDHMDQAESRMYIQTWLHDERPEDQAIKQVFSATTAILKAGRPTSDGALPWPTVQA
jgi:hypothetical protein